LFGAKFKKTALADSALKYAVDHSAFIYVIDRNGRLRETFPFGAAREDILSDLQVLVKEGINS
jgi:cytochrome oxidase Cu insertion factor (SCO1/SenC/PrrC family)